MKLKSSVKPVQHGLRSLPVSSRETVKRELDELLENDVIEPIGASEFVSGMVVVAKKKERYEYVLTGEWKYC